VDENTATVERPLLVFAHANSFPASTYRVLFRQLEQRGYSVRAIEKLGHDPAYPVTSNWPYLVRQLADFAGEQAARSGRPVCLVGHSLGGYLSLMCAALCPDLGGFAVRGVVMLDSPLIGGWRARVVGLAKHFGIVGAVPPGAISRKRRTTWSEADEAHAHFKGKEAFAPWHDEVLRDYIAHGTHDVVRDSVRQRTLSFDRDVETAIYNSLPHNLDELIRHHPVRCPVAFIGGLDSAEIRQVGMGLTRKVTGGRITMLDGGHLFPMERPEATAAAIEAALINLGRTSPD
jgi:pimeloyl-ACP methyl ester carboxylesterase